MRFSQRFEENNKSQVHAQFPVCVWPGTHITKKAVIYFFYTILMLLFVDGFFPQLQHWIFGEVIFFTVYLKMLMVLSSLMLFLNNGCFQSRLDYRSMFSRGNLICWMLFLTYVALDGLTVNHGDIPFFYYIFSINAYYFYLLILPLTSLVQVKAHAAAGILFLISVPLILLGSLQFLYNDPIIYTGNAGDYIQMISWNFYGQVRAFSLFNYSGSFGYFLSAIACLVMFYITKKRKLDRIYFVIFFLIVMWAIYTTLTRTAYMAAAMSLCTGILLSYRDRVQFGAAIIKIIPVLYLIISLIVSFYGVLITKGNSSLLSGDSLLMRYSEWKQIFFRWIGSGMYDGLFGLGLIQNDRFEFSKGLIIDNVYLAIGVHIGLIGLILWIILMWSFWSTLVKMQVRYPDNPIIFATVASWSIWMATGMFAITTVSYPVFAIIAFSTVQHDKKYLNKDSKTFSFV